VELPDGKTLLYDVGRLGAPYGASRSVAGHLWSRGIHHVDAVVLSHADIDHFNGLPGLLEQFSVGVVYVSPMMFEEESGSLKALSQALVDADVPVVEISAGDRLSAGDCQIDVWHPTRQGVLDSDNANSVVLSIEYQGRRIMLPGDLESLGLDYLMAEEPYDTDVLLAPHHGSPRSDPPGFAAWSTPELVVISGGHNDNVVRIAQAYGQEGGKVFDTAYEGAVTVTVAGGELAVTTMRNRSH
jgi:competence protein ComEC